MVELIPDILRHTSSNELIIVAEDYGAVLAQLGNHHEAVQLLGAADAQRDRTQYVREPAQAADIRGPFDAARDAMSPTQWDDAYHAGRSDRPPSVTSSNTTPARPATHEARPPTSMNSTINTTMTGARAGHEPLPRSPQSGKAQVRPIGSPLLSRDGLEMVGGVGLPRRSRRG